MNTATVPNNVSKFTRFDKFVLQGSMVKSQPPKAVTLAFIKRHTSSLWENSADLLNYHGKKHFTHHHCILENKKQLIRFNEDQDLIPKSTRIDFQCNVSQKAEQREEFQP